MKLVQKILLMICFWGIGILNVQSVAVTEQPLKVNLIQCEDGEEFLIKEETSANITPVHREALITVDTKKLLLTFYRDGKPFKIYPVAIGEPKTPSPIGEWKIIHKGGKWGDGFGARWIGLNVPWGIYGIHGTNKPWSIGRRSSHGCIRMHNKHVLELYKIVKLGMPVHIIGDLANVALRKEIGRNNTGQDIVLLQFAMRKAGFNPGPADGRFGPEMEQSLLKMQYFYGIAPTGRLSMNEQILLGVR